MNLDQTHEVIFRRGERKKEEGNRMECGRLSSLPEGKLLRPGETKYTKDGFKIHPAAEKEPLSDEIRQKRIEPPALLIASLLIGFTIGAGCGKIDKIYDQRDKTIRKAMIESLANKITQIEGMQMVNRNLEQVNLKVIKELITITEEKELTNLAVDTLVNVAKKDQIAIKGGAKKIKEYIQLKKEITSYFLSILEKENAKDRMGEKEEYRHEKYKDKIRKAIKEIYNSSVSENPNITATNLFIIFDLVRNADPILSNWAKERLELLKNNNPSISENPEYQASLDDIINK